MGGGCVQTGRNPKGGGLLITKALKSKTGFLLNNQMHFNFKASSQPHVLLHPNFNQGTQTRVKLVKNKKLPAVLPRAWEEGAGRGGPENPPLRQNQVQLPL